jgi:transcriptional regulator with XRE-family HTH domain
MKERIIEFLRSENKTSAQFAEEIGVQPSGISHIISGRNNPSLDFILKMLVKYPSLSSDWLLFGKGDMLRESALSDLFDSKISDGSKEPEKKPQTGTKDELNNKKDIFTDHQEVADIKELNNLHGKTKKIVCFFENNTFSEFFPVED